MIHGHPARSAIPGARDRSTREPPAWPRALPPGPLTWREQAYQNSLELKKQEYLKHARQVSYAMQGKSTAEIAYNKVNEFLEWLEIKDPSKIVRERRSM